MEEVGEEREVNVDLIKLSVDWVRGEQEMLKVMSDYGTESPLYRSATAT